MKDKTKNELRQELAHCFYKYGEVPEELIYNLESLLHKWYLKGVENGNTLQKSQTNII